MREHAQHVAAPRADLGEVLPAGFTDELVRLYLARDLADEPGAEADENERIEIVPWPRARLDDAIAQCKDSKSLIALLWLAARPSL